MEFVYIWNEFISEDNCGIWPLGPALLQYLKVIIINAATFIKGCKRREQIIVSKSFLRRDVDRVSPRGENCLSCYTSKGNAGDLRVVIKILVFSVHLQRCWRMRMGWRTGQKKWGFFVCFVFVIVVITCFPYQFGDKRSWIQNLVCILCI